MKLPVIKMEQSEKSILSLYHNYFSSKCKLSDDQWSSFFNENRNKFSDQPLQWWEVLLDMLQFHSRLRLSKENPNASLPKALSDAVISFIDNENLVNVWLTVICANNNISIIKRIVHQLVDAYRLIANVLCPMHEKKLSMTPYLWNMMSSLLQSITKDINILDNKTNINIILSILPNQAKKVAHHIICEDISIALNFVQIIEASIAIEILPEILKRLNNQSNQYIVKYNPVISGLLNNILQSFSINTILNNTLLSIPYKRQLIYQFLGNIPPSYYPDIIRCTTMLWGDPIFLSRGLIQFQDSLTFILLQTLPYITEVDLTAKLEDENENDSSSVLPLLVILSRGVSCYLDLPDKSSRLRGMKVAQAFSNHLNINNNKLIFTELEEENKLVAEQKRDNINEEDLIIIFPSTNSGHSESHLTVEISNISSNSTSTPIATSTTSKLTKMSLLTAQLMDHNKEINATTATTTTTISSVRSTADNDSIGSDSSSDCDSEDSESEDLQPLHDTLIEEVDDDEGLCPSRCHYLRQCLDFLRTTEEQKDVYDKHRAALLSIPRIVASYPADLEDVAPLLVRELLRIGNSFHMEKFDELRHDCMQSLLIHAPTTSAAMTTWVLTENDAVNLNTKLYALDELMEAAYVLADLPIPWERGIATSTGTTSTASLTSNQRMNHNSVVKVDANKTTDLRKYINYDNNQDNRMTRPPSRRTTSSTIIRRPKYLNNSKQPEKTVRNNFGPVAHLFFFPVLRALSKDRKKNNPRGSSSSSSSGSRMSTSEDMDGILSLLPSHALHSLAAFVRCAVNTPIQRTLVIELVRVALPIAQSHESGSATAASGFLSVPIGLRRASLFALMACLEAWIWLHQKLTLQRKLESHRALTASLDCDSTRDALATLTDITGTKSQSGASSGGGRAMDELDKLLETTMTWIASTLAAGTGTGLGSDLQSRAILGEIIKLYTTRMCYDEDD